MTLGRPATGLPRYYLDVGWWRHPRFAGLGLEALWCWQAGVSYCTQHATDGRMPADVEELSLALGVKLSVLRKGLRQLVDRGVWSKTADTVLAVGFEDHNPVAAEVAEHSERQRSRGGLGNHTRWHKNRGIFDPSCPYCTSPGESPSDHRQATSPEGSSPGESLGMGWDGMGTSSSDGFTTGDVATDDDQDQQPDPGKPDPTVETALAILADRALAARQANDQLAPVGDPMSWTGRDIQRRRDRYGDQPRRLLDEQPDLTPEGLADLLEPPLVPAATEPERPRPAFHSASDDPWPVDVDPAKVAAIASARDQLRRPHRAEAS